MKGIFFGLLGACLVAAGCANDDAAASSKARRNAARGDEIEVQEIWAKPGAPAAFQPWRACMKLKNVSKYPIAEIHYLVFAGKSEIGRGRIPLLKSHQEIEIMSDLTQKNPGVYRVEGRVLMPQTAVQMEKAASPKTALSIDVVVSD